MNTGDFGDCRGYSELITDCLISPYVSKVVKGSSVTTFAIGGLIDLFIEPPDLATLRYVIERAKALGLSVKYIGGGSNLLIPDEGVKGIVIKLGKGFRQISVYDAGSRLIVGAAVSLMSLSRQTARDGFSGLEFAAGIPATIGGAVTMNAGAHRGEIASVLASVTLILSDGDIVKLSINDLSPHYRTMKLPSGCCVTEVEFRLVASDVTRCEEQRRKNLEYRKQTQPLQVPSAGSTFRNPPNDVAGRIIDQCGMKGERVGGAEVSRIHANWLVNPEKAASAHDVIQLIERCRNVVELKTGALLEPELVIW
jgi:UDP-N-acetylmuramate dehydrogenase